MPYRFGLNLLCKPVCFLCFFTHRWLSQPKMFIQPISLGSCLAFVGIPRGGRGVGCPSLCVLGNCFARCCFLRQGSRHVPMVCYALSQTRAQPWVSHLFSSLKKAVKTRSGSSSGPASYGPIFLLEKPRWASKSRCSFGDTAPAGRTGRFGSCFWLAGRRKGLARMLSVAQTLFVLPDMGIKMPECLWRRVVSTASYG